MSIDPATGCISGSAAELVEDIVAVQVTDNWVQPRAATHTITLTIVSRFGLQWSNSGPGGQPQFSFIAREGDTYEVYSTDQLSSLDWQPLERITNAPAVPDAPDTNASQQFVHLLWIPGKP